MGGEEGWITLLTACAPRTQQKKAEKRSHPMLLRRHMPDLLDLDPNSILCPDCPPQCARSAIPALTWRTVARDVHQTRVWLTSSACNGPAEELCLAAFRDGSGAVEAAAAGWTVDVRLVELGPVAPMAQVLPLIYSRMRMTPRRQRRRSLARPSRWISRPHSPTQQHIFEILLILSLSTLQKHLLPVPRSTMALLVAAPWDVKTSGVKLSIYRELREHRSWAVEERTNQYTLSMGLTTLFHQSQMLALDAYSLFPKVSWIMVSSGVGRASTY